MEKRPRLMNTVGEPGQKCESESASSSVLLDPLRARATLCSLPGPSVHGIFQVRILEWVAIPFSRDLSHPGIKPVSPALQADSLLSEPPGEPPLYKAEPQSPTLLCKYDQKIKQPLTLCPLRG